MLDTNLLKKHPHGPHVVVGVAAGEPLVGCVEPSQKFSLMHHLSYHLPLFVRWINTCWVVCACVQQNNGAFGHCFQVFQEAVKVKSACLRVIVAITFKRGQLQARVKTWRQSSGCTQSMLTHPSVRNDLAMILPGGIAAKYSSPCERPPAAQKLRAATHTLR
jgi:hypothetical protein